ncbi:hypothetical protein D3C71_1055600 [compost metagenome]
MLQQRVAAGVAVFVVGLVEIIQIDHRQPQRRVVAGGAGQLALQQFVQAAPVQGLGQRIDTRQIAGRAQILFQLVDALFRAFHFLPCAGQVIACLRRLLLHFAGVLHHFLQQVVEVGDAARLAQLQRVAADAVVVFTGTGSHAVHALDELAHQATHGRFRIVDSLPQQALFVDHFAQLGAGALDRFGFQRPGQQLAHGCDLALQPAAVIQQLADVLQQQCEQLKQQRLLFLPAFGAHADLVAQLARALFDRFQCRARLPLAQAYGQGLRLLAQVGIVLQQRDHRAAQQQPQLLGQAQAVGLAIGRMLVDGADVFVDQLPHRPAIARPIGTGLRRLQAIAHVAQLAGQGGHAIGEGGQQRLGCIGSGEQLLQCHAVPTLQHHPVAAPVVDNRAHARRRSDGGAGGRAGVGLVRHGTNPGVAGGWSEHIGATGGGLNR